MKPIEGRKQFPVILGSQETTMLAALAEEDDRSKGHIIRILIRREFLRRQAAKYEARAEQVPA